MADQAHHNPRTLDLDGDALTRRQRRVRTKLEKRLLAGILALESMLDRYAETAQLYFTPTAAIFVSRDENLYIPIKEWSGFTAPDDNPSHHRIDELPEPLGPMSAWRERRMIKRAAKAARRMIEPGRAQLLFVHVDGERPMEVAFGIGEMDRPVIEHAFTISELHTMGIKAEEMAELLASSSDANLPMN